MEQKDTVKKRSENRFNVIDAIIIIVLIACILGLVFRFGKFGKNALEENLETYEIYFSVSDIAYTSEDAFVAGDTVTLADSGVVLGEFSRIGTILPAEFVTRDKSGNLISVNYPASTRIDVTGYITSQGIMTENGYFVGGTAYVASGTEYVVRSEHMDFVLEILNVVKK